MGEIEASMRRMEEAFESYEKMALADSVATYYGEFDVVYRALHEHHSEAYRSGSPLYCGERLPWGVFTVIVLQLGVIAQLQALASSRKQFNYLILRDTPLVRGFYEIQLETEGALVIGETD